MESRYRQSVEIVRSSYAGEVQGIHKAYQSVRSKRNSIWLNAITGGTGAMQSMRALARRALS